MNQTCIYLVYGQIIIVQSMGDNIICWLTHVKVK